jgi:hypothetical protein
MAIFLNKIIKKQKYNQLLDKTTDYCICKNKLTDYIYVGYNKFYGQYLILYNKIYKLNNTTSQNNKIIYSFENDIILEIIKTKHDKIIYNIYSSGNHIPLFYPQKVEFIKEKIVKKYIQLLNGEIELDLIYNLIKS